MKSFIGSSGRVVALLPLLLCVTQAKFNVHTFVPEALRKAKQGLDVVLRKSPPPVPVIPQRTGHAAIDQALFQTLQWGNSLKHSLSQQCALMFTVPTLTRIVSTATPTAMLLLVAHSLFQFFQSNLRHLFSSSEQVTPKPPMDVAKTVAWTAAVGVCIYQMQTLLRTHPALVFGEALLFSTASILWKRNEVSLHTVSPTIADDDEMIVDLSEDSIITMDVIVPENESLVTILDEDIPTVESTLESPQESEERSVHVDVTKISAVLDRFESKILSLVGGTRFAAASKHPEVNEEEDESASPLVTTSDVAEAELDSPQVNIEMTQFAEDDLVEVLYDEADESEDFALEHEISNECEAAPLKQPQLVPSLSSYEIMTPSKTFSRLNMATKSIMTTMTLIGIVASQVSAFQSIPSIVRHSLVTMAALCLLGLLVHELHQVWMTKSPTIGSFDSLLQEVETSASSFSMNMDPLIVELARRPHLRFFRTHMPILDGIAGIAKRIASSTTSMDEPTDEVKEDIPTEMESFAQCISSKEGENSLVVRPNTVAPFFRRWVTPRTSSKVACTSIVGL